MRCEIHQDIFAYIPDAAFGVVAAKGIGNAAQPDKIAAHLADVVAGAGAKWHDQKVKSHPVILPYREALQSVGINPNRFMCSIEALLTRISKGKGMPSISPLVDAYNAISIAHEIPIGGHDAAFLDNGTLTVRPATTSDFFIPFGGTEADKETPDVGEIIYASGNRVCTRRFWWRQSEIGKITAASTDILFPIDGFIERKEDIIAAAKELESVLQTQFGATVQSGLVTKDNPIWEWK